MKLSARDARAARACLLTASLAGVDLSFEPHGRGTDEFSLTLADGTTVIDQPNAAALAIAQAAAAPEKKAALLGDETDKEARAQIADWLSSVHSTLKLINDDALKVLNDALLDRTFLVASSGSSSTTTSFLTSPSLADVVVAAHVADACSAFPEAQLAHFPCVARWYDHVAALIGGRVVVAEEGGDGKPLLPRARLDRPPLKAPAAAPAAAAAGAGAGAAAAKGGKGDDKKKGGGSGAAAAAAATGAAAAPAAAAAAAPPAAAEGDAAASGGGGGKKEKKEKKPKAAPAAAAADAAAPARPDDAFDLLDVRVGKVVAAQKHPDADSLYQEEIDLGEASGPRTIVSGLAKWIPLEQFQGRMVCVVTNLKPAKMRGVLSSGMVLCASTETEVVPVDPPRAAKPGDRVVCEGFTQPAEPGHLNPKKKNFEKIAPHLTTDASGKCLYKGLQLVVEGGAGEVTSTVASGVIR